MLATWLVHLAIVAIVQINGMRIEGGDLLIDLTFHPANRELQRTTLVVDRTNVTASNFVPGLKTRVITFVENQYGVTIVADDVLIVGAPQ